MHSRVMRVKMARYRRHIGSLFSSVWDVCCEVLELLETVAMILLIAVPAGIGFGWGLALITALF